MAVPVSAGLPLMATATGVEVTRVVYHEAPVGTLQADGDLALSTQAVNRYMAAGHDISTSADLVKALLAHDTHHTFLRGLAVQPASAPMATAARAARATATAFTTACRVRQITGRSHCSRRSDSARVIVKVNEYISDGVGPTVASVRSDAHRCPLARCVFVIVTS